jgi:oligopeptide transport system substrate-binding protein
MITDNAQAWNAYKAGELDIIDVPPPNVQEVLTTPALTAQLQRVPSLATWSILFNVEKPPFDNADVRRAASTAIDREAFVARLNQGVGKPAHSWIPPGMPGHQPDLGQQYRFDPARAREYLQKSGVQNPQLTLTFANTGRVQQDAQFFQESIRQGLGIEVTLEPLEVKAFTEAVTQGNYQLALFGWGADYPDPDNWLPEIFGSGAGNNLSRYKNPAFDQLAAQAITEPDATKRLALWAQAQTLIVDEAVMVFTMHPERFVVVKPHVKGVRLTPIEWTRFVDEVRIEKR